MDRPQDAPGARRSQDAPDARRPEGASVTRNRWAQRCALLLPAVVAAALYLPSLPGALVWDDELHIPLAREMTVALAFGNAGGEYRRPMVLLSYMAQWECGLASNEAFHGVNLVLHATNTLLLALLLLALELPAAVVGGAAMMFAVHPVQSGSVAYISGRTDLLAAVFTLMALLLAAWFPHAASARDVRARPLPDRLLSARSAAGALACASLVALAALSKEIGLAAGPLVALVYRYQLRKEPPPSPLLPIAALLASASCALVVLPPAALTGNLSLALRLRAAGTAAATFAQLLVWPSGLHLDRLTATAGPHSIAVAIMLAGIACAAWVRFLRTPTLPGLALVSATLLYLPGSGFVPVSPAIAERLIFTPEQFLYLPLAPLSALLAAALHRYVGCRATVAGACLLAVLWAPSVLARQREFTTAEQVYRTTLAHSPSPRACFNLGRLQLEHRRYEEAASTYERCVDWSPHDAGARGQLATALQKLGRSAEARANYQRATELDERSALLWSNFATLDANEGRYDEARAKWERALSIDPSFAPAQDALSKLRKISPR